MSFASPFMLLGLLVIAPVLWLHLRKQKEKTVSFPAVALLVRVAEKRAPRIKIRNLLLLVIRLLVVLVLVFALSRPELTVWRPGGIRSGAPLAQVIVFDDTLSMQQKLPDGKTAFEAAVKMTLSELDRLRPGDGTALILMGYPARILVDGVTFETEKVRNAVSAIQPGYRSNDLENAVKMASQMLADAAASQREILVITDLQGEGLSSIATSQLSSDIRVLGAVKGEVPSNLTVEEIAVNPSGDGVSREVVIEARIANHGAHPVNDLNVALELDRLEVAQGKIDIPAYGFATKKFHHRFEEEGLRRGSVKIDDDLLNGDNRRHLSTNVRGTISATIINGDYRPGSYMDEAFYLYTALKTPMDKEVPIAPVVIDVETAGLSPLTGNDVVFLAGVDDPPLGLCDRLIEFVEGGGGLFISAGKRGSHLEGLKTILPATVRSVRTAPNRKKFFKMGAVNRIHPVFESFKEQPVGLEDLRVKSHLLVEPDPTLDRSVIAQLADGMPLLLERKIGKGVVMLLTTTLDRDWTDLPIRPGYLPLVQRATRYLARRLSQRDPRSIQVGKAIDLEVTGGMQRLVVRNPRDVETVYSANELAQKTRIWFDRTELPGPYRIWAEVPGFGGLTELYSSEFVVQADPKESNLARSNPAASGIKSDDEGLFTAVKGKLPLWPYFLFAMLICLLIETIIAGAGLRRSHAVK